MKILLISPPTPDTFWSFKHVLRFVSKRAAFPPLGLLTVAATLPADWQLKLVDLNVCRLTDKDLRWADYVMLSAMIVHKESVGDIVERCRSFGKPIIAGGPLFTTGHAAFPHIDHFVLGEAEELVTILQQAGLDVMGGFIVGFDSDPIDIFKRQFEFIQRSGVVTAMVGLLTALPETRLYRRLMQEGRLETETTGNNTQAALNFRPTLSREFLITGYRELMRKLYEPRHYYQRIHRFLEHKRPGVQLGRISRSDLEAFLKSLWLLGVWHRGRLRLLAILHRHTPQTTTSVPSRPRTGHHRPSLPPCGQVAVTQPFSKRYFIFASRKSGDRARVKRTTSSPVMVLMSWCMVTTLTPVTFSTIASRTGRAVSIRWVRTCFSKSRPFSAGSDLTKCCSAAVKTPWRRTTRKIPEQVGVDVLGAPAHVILLEATDSLADGSFDLSLGSHGNRL